MPSQTGGAPSTSDLASICTKTTDIQTYAAAQTTAGNPIKVNSLYRLNDLGIFGDSGNATITGYITNSSGTNATLNVVSTPYGSLALATGTETADLTGNGLARGESGDDPAHHERGLDLCDLAQHDDRGWVKWFASDLCCRRLQARAAGPGEHVKGYIDTTGGVSTLHVTSLDDGTTHSGFASGTGHSRDELHRQD